MGLGARAPLPQPPTLYHFKAVLLGLLVTSVKPLNSLIITSESISEIIII